MQEITVDKAKLRDIIQKNRDGHRAIFEEALAGYRTQAVAILEDLITSIRAGKVARIAVNLPYPQDHTRDYDRVLAMLDMDEGDKVALDEHEFQQYVQDDWSWKRQFLASNASYSVTAASTLEQASEDA